MAKYNETETAAINLISNGTEITGDVKSTGDIRIDGTLNGSLSIKGKLVVGVTGRVDGELSCQNADISGTVNGKVKITELLSLKATSKLSSDINTNKLSIESGANFSGSCTMAGSVPNIKLNNGQGEAPKSEKTAAY